MLQASSISLHLIGVEKVLTNEIVITKRDSEDMENDRSKDLKAGTYALGYLNPVHQDPQKINEGEHIMKNTK